jgi:acid-sensing ion channel 5
MSENKNKAFIRKGRQVQLFDDYKSLLVEFGKSSTAHGISNILRSNNKLVSLIWLIFFFSSISFCFFTIINLIVKYTEYKVFIKFKIEIETNVNFPAVTFCNLNPFDRRGANKYIDKILAKNNLSYIKNIFKIDKTPQIVNKLIKSYVKNDKNLTKNDLKNLGFSLEYLMVSCEFDGVNCTSEDFIWSHDYNYGNCYTFNSGFDPSGNPRKIKKVSDSGSKASLRMELFLGDEFFQTEYILNTGLRLAIHNQTSKPILKNEAIDLPNGFLTEIGITRSLFHKLGKPYSNCIEKTYSFNSFKSFYYQEMFTKLNMTKYRHKECQHLCLQDYIKTHCDCLDGSLPIIYDTFDICDTIETIECVQNKTSLFYDTSHLLDSCDAHCPNECETERFSLSQAYSRYPTIYYYEYLMNAANIMNKLDDLDNVDYKYFKERNITKSLIGLNIFYDQLHTTHVQEIAEISFGSLLGNIGGCLGLFTGISLLSFIEIFDLVIEFIFTYRLRIKNNERLFEIK